MCGEVGNGEAVVEVPRSIRPSSRDQQQPNRIYRQGRGDLSRHPQRQAAECDSDRQWQGVRPRFSAAHAASPVSANSILRLAITQLQVEIPVRADVGLVLSRLVLAS